MRLSFFLSLEVLFLGNFVLADWCAQTNDCSDNGATVKHLRCSFKELKDNALCSKIKPKMDARDRARILHYHNVLRDNVSKGASTWKLGRDYINGWDHIRTGAGNMLQLIWDDELEENARIYASQCNVKAHKPYQCSFTKDVQSVYMSKYDNAEGSLTMGSAINKFASSKKYIKIYYTDYVLVRAYIPGPWDEFFAMVYGPMRKLGCSRVMCGCNQIKPLYETGSVICLYGPAPDFLNGGFRVFQRSAACRHCPNNTSCRRQSAYKHLCAEAGDPLGPSEDLGGSARLKQTLLPLLLVQLIVTAHPILAH